jgi:hypothetical protein
MKTHWKKLENPDYIGAYSLDQGKDLTVVIEKVVREMITGTGGKKEECSVAYLKNQKPMILNRTNQKTIAKVLNTPYIEEWQGKSITIYIAHIKAFGEDNVECLRVRPKAPEKLPELKQTDKANFEKVVSALKNGFTIEQVKTKWTISNVTEQLLKQEAGV